jgi:hypothetical protein
MKFSRSRVCPILLAAAYLTLQCAPAMKAKPPKRKPAPVPESLETSKRGDNDARDGRLKEFQLITATLERAYSYLQIKQKRWRFSYSQLKSTYEKRLSELKGMKDYRNLLREFLGHFKDGHLRINYPRAGSQPGSTQMAPAISHRWVGHGILLTRIARLWGDEKAIAKGLNEGLTKLKSARALIVDLRGNGGGNDALVLDYISKIVPRRIPLGRVSLRLSPEVLGQRPHYKRLYQPDPSRPGYSLWLPLFVEPQTKTGFSGPIAVLIDKACYSSCETAALAFRVSQVATLYGQATGGGSANPIFIKLPRGGKMMVPTWIHRVPGGKLLEDNGIAPHTVLKPTVNADKIATINLRQKLERPRCGSECPSTMIKE